MYADDLRGNVHCRSCGQPFQLSAFSRTQPTRSVVALRLVRRVLTRVRVSPVTIYGGAGLATIVIVWVLLSVAGFIPDELRPVNRRFVSISNPDRIEQAVGLLAVGVPNLEGTIDFSGSGSAWAISNDGFMVTCRHVLERGSAAAAFHGRPRIWVFLDKRRHDAEIVWTDIVSDIALIKIDAYIAYRFRVGERGSIRHLNAEVVALGFQEMPAIVESSVVETEIASTRGTISRVFQDSAGTRWVEHTAPLKSGSSGGPLLLADYVVSINTGGSGGVYQALDVTEYHDQIFAEVTRWRERSESE